MKYFYGNPADLGLARVGRKHGMSWLAVSLIAASLGGVPVRRIR
jgi:hypothetical protein